MKKTTKFFGIIALAAAIGVVLTACPTDGPGGSDSVNIYIAGSYEDSNRNGRACYWKGTERTDLPVPEGNSVSFTTGIAVVNNTVYTVGGYEDGDYLGGNNRTVCYWIGTERTDLPVPEGVSDSEASGIAVVNNTVYTVGS